MDIVTLLRTCPRPKSLAAHWPQAHNPQCVAIEPVQMQLHLAGKGVSGQSYSSIAMQSQHSYFCVIIFSMLHNLVHSGTLGIGLRTFEVKARYLYLNSIKHQVRIELRK